MLPMFNTIMLVLLVMFIAYVLCIVIPFLRHRPVQPGDVDAFSWHLFVPCRDEESVIDLTIRRALRTFPQAHIWIIDDDSDDRTADIAEEYATFNPHVHVVRRRRPNARTGKGDALNTAYRTLSDWLPAATPRDRVVIGVVDADGELAGNALEIVSSASIFGDPSTGAAQVAVWMKNRDERRPLPGKGRLANWFASGLLRVQDIEFRTVISAMQSLRAGTGTVGLGGNGQFTRLSVLDAIGAGHGNPWHGALLEDYELGLHVHLSGYDVKHVYDTHVSQEALPDLRRLLVQRTRWAQGNIQCLKYLPRVIASEHFDSAGVVETAYYLFLPFIQLLGMTAVVGAAVCSVPLYIADPGLLALRPVEIAALAGTVFVLSVIPFGMWGVIYRQRCEPLASPVQAVRWGLAMWAYVYYTYVCIVHAFWRVIVRRNGWAKTRRNADIGVVKGSVAIEH